MGVWSRISLGLGRRRRFVRRLAGLCLILLGVHAAADRLDDFAYASLDALDLALDRAFLAFVAWLGDLGILTLPKVQSWSEGITTFIGVSEKDRMALVFGLAIEVSADLLLLDLAWGLRRARQADEEPPALLESLRRSGAQLKEAIAPLDVEKLILPLCLFVLSVCGAAIFAVAMEMLTFDLFGGLKAFGGWDRLVSAGLGLFTAALLILRFGPDLVDGAINRADQRGTRFATRVGEKRLAAGKAPLKEWQEKVLRGARGWLSALLILPLTGLSLLSMGPFFDLIRRLGAWP
jgi:hypothetical protein